MRTFNGALEVLKNSCFVKGTASAVPQMTHLEGSFSR
jgi:hypothetical protein